MSELRNQTFRDQDQNLKYTGGWTDGIWNASNGDNGTLHATNDQFAQVTFTFPVPANAFYYYGMKRSNGGRYGICIDDSNCVPGSPNLRQIDAFDSEDDGHSPPVLLFSQNFDTFVQHNITLINLRDPNGNNPPGNSQMILERFELQVLKGNPSSPSPSSLSPPSSTSGISSTTLSVSPTGAPAAAVPLTSITYGMSDASSASSLAPAASSSAPPIFSNDASPTGAIIGGIVGALIAVFVFLFFVLRKRNIHRRQRHAESSIGTYSTGLNLSTHASHVVSSNYTHSKQYRSQKEPPNSLGYEFGYGVGIGIADMNKLDKKRGDEAIAKGSSRSKSRQKEPSEPLGYELGYGVGVGLSDMNKLDKKRGDEAIAKGSSESKSNHSRRAVDAGRVLDSQDAGMLPPGYDQVFRGDEPLVPVRREEV